jgi:hypothetical protein
MATSILSLLLGTIVASCTGSFFQSFKPLLDNVCIAVELEGS